MGHPKIRKNQIKRDKLRKLYLRMDSAFAIEIDKVRFNFISMNTQRAQLFQVYVDYQGQKRRFHFKEDGKALLFLQ